LAHAVDDHGIVLGEPEALAHAYRALCGQTVADAYRGRGDRIRAELEPNEADAPHAGNEGSAWRLGCRESTHFL
jgi:hypothetical protein